MIEDPPVLTISRKFSRPDPEKVKQLAGAQTGMIVDCMDGSGGLHHRITVLDLVLPRILAGEKIGKAELAFLGHGGLCKDCEACVYPHCPFGK